MEFQVGISPKLGNYLGVPLISGRVTRGHFQHIIDKMEKHLSGWKAKNLSFAGRATLVSSVLSGIPAYTMQSVWLPQSVSDHINKIQRNFLWGSTSEKRRLHLVRWHQVHQPKKCGGVRDS